MSTFLYIWIALAALPLIAAALEWALSCARGELTPDRKVVAPGELADCLQDFLDNPGKGLDSFESVPWASDPEIMAILLEGLEAGAFVPLREYAGNEQARFALLQSIRTLRELQQVWDQRSREGSTQSDTQALGSVKAR